MGRSMTKEEIFELSIPERLQLIETLWDSISPNELPVPDAHKAALDHSLAEYERDPESGRSWDQLRDDLRK
jgi:putative addiction module component (TIGR02574 family)